jgi:hypothetical protein
MRDELAGEDSQRVVLRQVVAVEHGVAGKRPPEVFDERKEDEDRKRPTVCT